VSPNLVIGEHYTDCFFLSKRVPVNEIVRQVEKSAKALGWSVSLLGEISGKQYDDIYNKTLLGVMTNA
jgi:hypothetical protein